MYTRTLILRLRQVGNESQEKRKVMVGLFLPNLEAWHYHDGKDAMCFL